MTLLAKWRAWLRARLIEDWNRAYKLSSVQLAAAGAALAAFIQWFPNVATDVWNAVPRDMRDLLPAWLTHTLPVILFVAIAVARVTRKAPTDAE
jgi:hypothetical protein